MLARESDLYAPVRDWLARRGYIIHAEIFGADIVATKGETLAVVELKLCCSQGLINQLHDRAGWANEVWGAIPTEPRYTHGFKHFGFGLLIVENGKIRIKCRPKPQPWLFHRRRKYRWDRLQLRHPAQPHETAGLPSCPALRLQRDARVGHCQPPAGA
jgi:hypothetical protein